jgi:hypothetical protein
MKYFVVCSMVSLFIGIAACENADDTPQDIETVASALDIVVTTGDATMIGQSNARLGVTVTGSDPVSECGVCWGGGATGLEFITQTSPYGERCMRQIPCLNAAYYTNDGYMDPIGYFPGSTYGYRAYAFSNSNTPIYGNVKYFTVPKVVTGNADVQESNARLGVTVTATSPIRECGVCWGPVGSGAGFVEQTTGGVRCMRQIPCLNASYYTNDGYMDQREYSPGTTYNYKAYAVNDAGVAYGDLKTFSVPQTVQCIYSFTGRCWPAPYTNLSLAVACGSSLNDAFSRNLPLGKSVCNPGVYQSGCCIMETGGTIPH